MAFLDVGVYVTSLRAVKNLLIVGDDVEGAWFVAFQVSSRPFFLQSDLILTGLQEEPFKLQVLSKARQSSAVSSANFFFGLDGQLSFITAGEDGAIRAFEYSPHRESYNSLNCDDMLTLHSARCCFKQWSKAIVSHGVPCPTRASSIFESCASKGGRGRRR